MGKELILDVFAPETPENRASKMLTVSEKNTSHVGIEIKCLTCFH